MTIRSAITTLLCASAVAAFAGCQQAEKEDNDGMESHEHSGMNMKMNMSHENMWSKIHEAVAVIYPTKGNTVSGAVHFVDVDGGVHVMGSVSGLDPNSVHAIHIHEFGDQTSDNGTSAGSHYNPEGHPHGQPDPSMHHAGDLGNLTADASGKASIDLTLHGISVAGMMDPIIGRGLVIHAKPDDFSQPVGNAGGRIGVGVIGVAQVAAPATQPK